MSSSSLNILCAVCNEFFQNTDVIFSTKCGHVFHRCCLFKWLTSSSTCPQCRKYCPQRFCHRLYVNFVERTGDDESETEIDFPKCYDWIHIGSDFIEPSEYLKGALKFGKDEYGNDIYAARGEFNGDILPAYYVPQKKAVIAAWGWKSHRLIEDIELLDISNDDAVYEWVAASGGNIPEYAFATGRTELGDILYTARAEHNGRILYGKLHQRYNLAYMPYKDLEVSNGSYEVLVRVPRETNPSTSPANSNGSTSDM